MQLAMRLVRMHFAQLAVGLLRSILYAGGWRGWGLSSHVHLRPGGLHTDAGWQSHDGRGRSSVCFSDGKSLTGAEGAPTGLHPAWRAEGATDWWRAHHPRRLWTDPGGQKAG